MRPMIACPAGRPDADNRGSVTALVSIAMLPVAMMLAVVVDAGRVWVERRALQTGVESSALAAAQEWTRTGAVCSPGALGFVDGNGPTPSSLDCSVTPTSSGAVVRVSAMAEVDLDFAALLGRSSKRVSASTAARVAPAGTATGLRPVALCSDNPSLVSWIAGGMTSTAEWTIPFESGASGCGGAVPGNWAVLDLNGGSNSTSEMQQWIDSGYPGVVRVGDSIYGDPGIPSPALNLDAIVGRTIVMPVFSNARLQGSRALYDVVGFVSVHLVSTRLSGSASTRNVVVQFQRVLSEAPTSPVPGRNFGYATVAVCSFDETGAC